MKSAVFRNYLIILTLALRDVFVLKAHMHEEIIAYLRCIVAATGEARTNCRAFCCTPTQVGN